MQANVSRLCQSVMKPRLFSLVWGLFAPYLQLFGCEWTRMWLTWGILSRRGRWSRTWCPGRSPPSPHRRGARPCCCICPPVRSRPAVTSGSGHTWSPISQDQDQHREGIMVYLQMDCWMLDLTCRKTLKVREKSGVRIKNIRLCWIALCNS